MIAKPDDCFHLSVEIVREIHAKALEEFGGLGGVRDENLLASAVLTPQSSIDEKLESAEGNGPKGSELTIETVEYPHVVTATPYQSRTDISRRSLASAHTLR